MSNQITEEKVFEELEIQSDCAEKTISEAKEIIRKSLKHIGVIFSLLAVVFVILIYVYQMGYLKVYDIPYKYIAINLQNHIPILYISVSYSVCGALHLIDWMTRKSFNSKSKFNFRRIAIFYLSSFNGIYHFLKISFLAKSWVAIGITFLLEIIAVLFEKGYIGFNKKRDILIDVYESVHKKIGRFVLFDCGIIIIALLLTFIYNVGDNTAKTQKEFEFLIHNESCYVVIADYKDKGIIQKAEVIKDKLVIDASKYHLISKDNIAIEYREFEKVTVKGAK